MPLDALDHLSSLVPSAAGGRRSCACDTSRNTAGKAANKARGTRHLNWGEAKERTGILRFALE
jgi:hypothetical protein